MNLRRVMPTDKRALREVEALLIKEGISLDRHLEYTVGLYDEDDRLCATGSFFDSTLRCLAVDSAFQGEGLMATVVSHLVSELFHRGRTHLFVYTKREAAASLQPLGFYPIAHTEQVVFLENRRDGFAAYLRGLTRPDKAPGRVAAVVMNANPFSLGHLHLVERARADSDTLHLFIVSEDVSAFPAAVRARLVREGTRHLDRIYYHQTGPYLVSSATFPSYFIKESDNLTLAHAQLDAHVFGRIAGELKITTRLVGEEPLSPATALYNRAMADTLPAFQVALRVLPRVSDNGKDPISASRVRALLAMGPLEAVRSLVPESTYAFLSSAEGQDVIRRLREGSAPK